MAESWTISVGSRVYGPYSIEQLRAFHSEGRLASHSLVARAGEEQFHPAAEDADLAQLFPPNSRRLPRRSRKPNPSPRPSPNHTVSATASRKPGSPNVRAL